MDVEQEQLVAVIRELMAAASIGDAAAAESVLADDVTLFKVGRVRRKADLVAAVTDFARVGGEARYSIADVASWRDGSLACLAFRTTAEIRVPGHPDRSARWLESVVLRRTDRWRILLYHSTDEAVDDQG